MPDQSITDFANRLRRCLDADDANAALTALITEPQALTTLPRIPRTKWYNDDEPHAIVGLATVLMAGALIANKRADAVQRFLYDTAALFGRANWPDDRSFETFSIRFPYLWAPRTVAAIATQNWQGAVEAITCFADAIKPQYRDSRAPPDPEVDNLLAHPKIRAYGPFDFDRHWVLDRQEEIIATARYDRTLEESYDFETLFVANALITKQPIRALPLIESLVEISANVPIAKLSNNVANVRGGRLEFNAVCALAALGQFDQALVLARAMIRQGYQQWTHRFKADIEAEWIKESLGPISQTGPYQAFLEEIAYVPLAVDDPASSPLCAVRDGVLEGKSRKRCWLTRKLIAPGDPVVRFRRLHEHASDGDFDIAAKAAFESSPWAQARRQFETDTIPLPALFPPQQAYRRGWHTSAIAAFHYDVANDPAAFDLDCALQIIAVHAPNRIRLNWWQGLNDLALAFKPFAADAGHGDAVNFTWHLLKAGFGNDLFQRASELPPAQSDKVFAMLAVFDRDDCRSAAAAHFDLPDLPAMMALAFSERPPLKAHLAMADFGDQNPRWRAGFVSAMQAYALHLYSNFHPGADWFLQNLEHFSRARCCQLLFFLIHHPEDDEVLATMIEKEWLPYTISSGAYDAYGNAQSFYYRAAVFNRMLHAPERLDFWLHAEWVNNYCNRAKDRETRRLAEQWLKRNPAGSRAQ